MESNKSETGQALSKWVWPLTVAFGASQLIAGIVFFFAYNWRDLPDVTKIALPQAAMIGAFLAFALLPRGEVVGRIAGIGAVVMIGVSMAVVGQVYQLGADPWRLFATWAALGGLVAFVLRDDVHFALALVIASVAYFLYTDQELRTLLPQAESLIPAVYSVLVLAVLAVRESVAGGPPPWFRWMMVTGMLGAVTVASLFDLFHFGSFRDGLFAERGWATLSLLICSGCVIYQFGYRDRDKPACALALFALSVFAGAFGVRVLLLADIDGLGGAAFLFIVGALWVVGVTSLLARFLRNLVSDREVLS